MTDTLLPGADRDLVKPLHKRLERLFEAIYLRHEGRQAGGRGRLRSKWPSRGRDGAERAASSAACWWPWAAGPIATAWAWRTRRSRSTRKGFVVVDGQQRTADPHILAIGDVAGEPMLAHKASHEGKVAVEALHGEPAAFAPRAIPAVVFTDPEIAWAGLTENEAKPQGRRSRSAAIPGPPAAGPRPSGGPRA